MMSSFTARVLLLGDDSTLLRTRELVLRRAGYRTRSLSDSRVSDGMEWSHVDVAIFCHSVPVGRAASMIRSMRLRIPDLLTIRLTRFETGPMLGFDSACDVSGGPARLLEELGRLCALKGWRPGELGFIKAGPRGRKFGGGLTGMAAAIR